MERDRLLRLSVILAVLILVGFEIAGRVVKTEDPLFPIVQTAVTRAVGAFVFVLLIRRMGYAPLFRDASHLGFPTYWIVVPGISELFDVSRLRLREGSSTVNSRRAFRHFPRLTPPEEENLLRLILFKERSTLENSLCNISGLYLKGDLLTADRVGACLALKCGRYPDAARLFRKAAAACREEKEQHYMCCLSEYARILHTKASRADALSARG